MSTFNVAITGASGQLGRLVAEQLLQRLDPAEVVLLTRDPSSLADFAARGAAVRRADFADASTLPAAFAGVQRLLLISTDVVGPQRVALQSAAIDAAASASVERIVYTSVPRPSADNPAIAAHDHAATEEHLRGSGLAWVMLRNNLYADMQLDTLRHAGSAGQLVTNAGDGRVAYVTRADCAAAAVGALLSDDADGAYDITGPAALGTGELAALAGRIGGRPVEVVDVDDAAFTAGLIAAGLPEPVAEVIATFGTATRAGLLADVSGAVRELTGHEPTPLAALLG